ncbi:hypothetical protein K7X08_028904 [Anisodus acutangulus]|uniref:mannan endo-1,4-beta-mannosidase n=1 Tax=Anisodus acutangulus TaxID=402998 RepID=A0A9Q1QT93_9SOLA|nr:hypothetical protein K7X08_028904 [Anisodus acutangulus]
MEIGMEGFYGDSMPSKKFNPGHQVGTDFINNHLIKEIDFATIHAYTDQWLSGQNDDAQMAFMQRWITSHWDDSSRVLKKPLVLAEFGKSSKDPGYDLSARDTFMNSVHINVYSYAIYGETMGGSLVWQQGMENFDDPSTAGIISGQSHAMTTLAHLLNNDPLGRKAFP